MICRRIILLFVCALAYSILSFAQPKHFYEPLYMELEQGKTSEVNFSQKISSVVVDVLDAEAFTGMAIYAGSEKYLLSADADAEIENGQRSNIIIFKSPVSHVTITSAEAKNIKIHALYAEPLSYSAAPKNFRLKTGACEKPITVDQNTWRKDLPAPKVVPSSNIVKHIIVHHTATSNSDTDFVKVVRNIYLYHTQVNGWDDIGYNFLIAPDGTIFQGRDGQDVTEDDNALGAHFCSKNRGTMGISMIGTFTEVPPTDTAMRSLHHLTAWKLNKEALYALDSALHPENSSSAYYLKRISGHRDGCATECPGDSLYALLAEVRAETYLLMKDCTPPTVSIQNQPVNKIRVYPQPAYNFLYIDVQENALGSANYLVQDVFGRKAAEGEIIDEKVDISNLPPGFYLLSIYKGAEKCFVRFIKN